MTLLISKILAGYSLFLVLFGTIGNLIVFVVSIRLRRITTFVFIAFLAVSDTFTLYYWNLNHFIYTFLGYDIENDTIVGCKLGNFVQFSSLEISSWLLVALSLDRYFCVSVSQWKTIYFRPKRAFLTALAITALIMIVAIQIPITFGTLMTINGTTVEACFTIDNPSIPWMNTWSTVHAFIYSYIPFMLLALTDALLIRFLKRNRRRVSSVSSAASSSRKNDKSSVNRLVISLTILFITLSLPGTISSAYYTQFIVTDVGEMIIFLFDGIAFSYHAYNIIILSLTNKKFFTELKLLFNLIDRSDPSIEYTVNTRY